MVSTGSNSGVPTAEIAASPAEVVVALTTYNDVRTIGPVLRSIREGLARYFASSPVCVVVVDAGSSDGTLEAAREAAGSAPLVEVSPASTGFSEMPYHGRPGRPAAVRAVLERTSQLGTRGCAFVDAGLEVIEPDRIERLIGPVLSGGFDYVSPYYVRRVDEGAITRGIVYPMFRMLYGVRLRQPAAVEFGCSSRLVAHLLERDFWDADQAQVGIDLWLAVAAVCGGFRTCETSLGVRRAAPRDTPADLSTTLAQIVGALFVDMERRVDVWQRTRGSLPVPLMGTTPVVQDDPPHLNREALLESFRLGYRELREIWTWVLPPRTLIELRRLAETAPDRFRLEDRLWASIIYDFALAYSLHVLPRDHLLRSLTPLYTGWLASFILQMRSATLPQIEDRVDELCAGFESEKRYLISRWRWPERLR